MTYIAESIRAALAAMSAVADYNGSGSADEMVIRFGYLEEDDTITDPHIVIDIDSDTPQNDIEGHGGLRFADVTVTCRATTMNASKGLAEAVRVNGTNPGTGLAGYGGSGTTFDAWLEDETRGIEAYDDNSGRFWHVVVQSYTVCYSETT